MILKAVVFSDGDKTALCVITMKTKDFIVIVKITAVKTAICGCGGKDRDL